MDTALLVVRVVLSLGVVLGVMWLVARRVGRRPAAVRGVAVDVVGRRSLGRRAGVAVVDVEGRRLVLGVSDTGVRLVADLGDVVAEPPTVRAVPPRPTRRPREDFAAVLAAQEAAGGAPRPTIVPAAAGPTAASTAVAPRRAPAARTAATAARPAGTVTSTSAPAGAGAPRRPAHRGEPAAARRAVARAVAPARASRSPLAGSVLDRATWTRARAALTGRAVGT